MINDIIIKSGRYKLKFYTKKKLKRIIIPSLVPISLKVKLNFYKRCTFKNPTSFCLPLQYMLSPKVSFILKSQSLAVLYPHRRDTFH